MQFLLLPLNFSVASCSLSATFKGFSGQLESHGWHIVCEKPSHEEAALCPKCSWLWLLNTWNCVPMAQNQRSWKTAVFLCLKSMLLMWNQVSISSSGRSLLLSFSSCQSPLSLSGIYKAPITSGSKWHGPPMEGSLDKITKWDNWQTAESLQMWIHLEEWMHPTTFSY